MDTKPKSVKGRVRELAVDAEALMPLTSTKLGQDARIEEIESAIKSAVREALDAAINIADEEILIREGIREYKDREWR